MLNSLYSTEKESAKSTQQTGAEHKHTQNDSRAHTDIHVLVRMLLKNTKTFVQQTRA